MTSTVWIFQQNWLGHVVPSVVKKVSLDKELPSSLLYVLLIICWIVCFSHGNVSKWKTNMSKGSQYWWVGMSTFVFAEASVDRIWQRQVYTLVQIGLSLKIMDFWRNCDTFILKCGPDIIVPSRNSIYIGDPFTFHLAALSDQNFDLSHCFMTKYRKNNYIPICRNRKF